MEFSWKGTGDGVPGKAKRYTPEFKERAVRLVVDKSLPIAQVARELGVSGTTLKFWVKDYRRKLAGPPFS
jgi:transposase-like protein